MRRSTEGLLAAVCQEVAVELGLPAPAIERLAGGQERIRAFGMDIRRARIYLGWAPSVCLKDGVAELLTAVLQ